MSDGADQLASDRRQLLPKLASLRFVR